MKKLTFLVYHKEYDDFLLTLRDLGVVHVETKQVGSLLDSNLQDAMKLYAAQIGTVKMLEHYVDPKQVITSSSVSIESGEELMREVKKLSAEKEMIIQEQQGVQKDIELMQPWGDFDYAVVDKLQKAGYQLNFYVCSLREYDPQWEVDYKAIIVNTVGSRIYFVIMTHGGEVPKLNVEIAKLSDCSLAALKERMDELTHHSDVIEERFCQIANEKLASLKALCDRTLESIEFSNVSLSGEKEADDALLLLQGWVPEEKESELQQVLCTKGVFYETECPVPEDNVPIQLKNGRFSKLFEPITEMFALPKYTELDLTPFLAPFFMLFFGLCMGDGGYGIIILLACFYAKRKVSPAMKPLCSLGIWLGISTIVVGIFTGSFWGIALDSVQWSWLKGVKTYFLTENNYASKLGGYNPMMIMALVVGIIQILYGMCLHAAKIAKQFGFRYAISTLAWVVFLIIVGITFGLPALGHVLPQLLIWLLYGIMSVCALLIFFYNSPGKNIFMNLGSGLWGTYNMATGLLGDTLSYIRLFALGLTGSILGGVFNSLAFDLTASLPVVVKFVAALLILLVGHSINFGLCMIAAFVHPMRLTFVEFYKNAGFEGGGRTYKPFKKK